MRKARSYRIAACVFILPTLIWFTVMVMYPTVRTLMMSTYNWDGIVAGSFTGIKNYVRLFKDPIFYQSLKNGFIFAAVITIYQLGLGTFFALTLLNKKIKGRNILRKIYFIPVVLSITVVCMLWVSMYNPNYGLFNQIFALLGLPQQNWLSSMGVASIIAVAMVNAWQYMGYQFTLLYSGAKAIPAEIYEAAMIDGASTFKAHIKISIPLMQETYRIVLIFCLIGGMNAFANMQIMTNGGPGTATYSLTFLMYRSAFMVSQYGYGCASAVILMLLCFAITLVVNRFVARERIVY